MVVVPFERSCLPCRPEWVGMKPQAKGAPRPRGEGERGGRRGPPLPLGVGPLPLLRGLGFSRIAGPMARRLRAYHRCHGLCRNAAR